MKKIDMYKPGGKGKEPVRKTIMEITEELQKRLESQGIMPDSSFLSSNFKSSQKNQFPFGKISGTISLGSEEVNAFLSIAGEDDSDLKGRMFIVQFKTENKNTVEAIKKASAALNVMLESFWVNTDDNEKVQETQADITKQKDTAKKTEKNAAIIKQSADPKEVAISIHKALLNPDIADEFNKLQQQGKDEQRLQSEETVKTITIPTGAKALNDEKIVGYFSKETTDKNNGPVKENDNTSNDGSIKNQLVSVNFTPEQAEVVIQLLEENQKKYEPKSSMFGLLGDVVGKMLQALSRKLDQIIDSEKIVNEKLNSIYSAINNENYELFVDRYKALEQKIKYCHDIICEAAQGKNIQSANIINHILNKEKVPVSIRTLQNAFVTAIDNNIDSALSIYRYADANLHGEAHFDTIRGFLSHALNTLPDNEAEKFINVSSIRAFDDTVIFKEMIRAEKYDLLNSSLQHCNNVNEHAPSLFYFAAQRKDADALHVLARKGADVNENNGEALYTCFETNKLETAKILINYGADVQSLVSRVEQIRKAAPNYSLSENNISFLNELYKYCGLGEYRLFQQLNQTVEQQNEVHGEDGDLGVHDGSW
ncbi:ankyrin repeat domain-containing protein [Ruminiclostridium cellobioparum]|uniref:Ankyrin repeat-containing protein n=1 Tax=Ruminiclostridium cellobioparum subsp. termitidis CT1112 TaxID=1195236 RepID=S0FJE6_RUMCE|nr:ankyrin repeat domain-containing protein [Ruminiclostridium cellobioparum]EMS72260.1 hypothetical protein CTER_1769 [Ruminiclostridium cellobioparum subsp. termitidis CT1112]